MTVAAVVASHSNVAVSLLGLITRLSSKGWTKALAPVLV